MLARALATNPLTSLLIQNSERAWNSESKEPENKGHAVHTHNHSLPDTPTHSHNTIKPLTQDWSLASSSLPVDLAAPLFRSCAALLCSCSGSLPFILASLLVFYCRLAHPICRIVATPLSCRDVDDNRQSTIINPVRSTHVYIRGTQATHTYLCLGINLNK